MLPQRVLHADWSSSPKKRWAAAAELQGDVYRISPPVLVEQPAMLARHSARRANGGCAVIGFDFPIGVPALYANQAKITRFLDVLPEFGSGRWQRFYDLAARPVEISLERPFYPLRPGGTLHAHLVQGLGVRSMNDLLRRCDFGDGYRNNACPLFWTLGGNQVGRAAISGWREVVVPAMRALRTELGIWPHEGDLRSLLSSRVCVVTETYPADACVQVDLPAPGRRWSKRDRQDRAHQGVKLLRWAEGKPMDLAKIQSALQDGFGPADVGEDQFDAVVGLLAMLAVVLGLRPEGAPPQGSGLSVEGWILGHQYSRG
jgi:hypothetical protein